MKRTFIYAITILFTFALHCFGQEAAKKPEPAPQPQPVVKQLDELDKLRLALIRSEAARIQAEYDKAVLSAIIKYGAAGCRLEANDTFVCPPEVKPEAKKD